MPQDFRLARSVSQRRLRRLLVSAASSLEILDFLLKFFPLASMRLEPQRHRGAAHQLDNYLGNSEEYFTLLLVGAGPAGPPIELFE